jgi:pimeloyl-ACP methyl ester carboxylesterase
MRLELVSIPTETEPLDGLFYTPDNGDIVGGALLFHGNCHNFYTGPSRFMPELLTQRGFACLAFNRRGHDMIVSLKGRHIGGGSFQTAREGIADNHLAAAWFASRGFKNPSVIGHSNGGMLAVRHCVDHPETQALVLMSAHVGGRLITPRISAAGLFAKDRLAELTDQAETMVAQGRGRDLMLLPDWWWVISAESFLDRSLNTPDILDDAPKLRCPTLYLRGDMESRDIYPAEEFAARTGAPCEVRIVPNCDHFYTGHEKAVTVEIADWLKQTCKLR